MSNEDRQLLGPMSQRILRGDKDWANPSLATLVGANPLPTKDRVQGVPDGRQPVAPPSDTGDIVGKPIDQFAEDHRRGNMEIWRNRLHPNMSPRATPLHRDPGTPALVALCGQVAVEEEVREGCEQGDQMTKPTNVFLPYICQAFGNAAKEYEAYKALPCPKPSFDGWGEVNELMEDLAASLSVTTGVEIVWDARLDMMINPLGEFGCFEKKETK